MKKQTNLFQFFSSSQTKPKQSDPTSPTTLKIEFKETSTQAKPDPEEDEIFSFRTLKKRKTDNFQEEPEEILENDIKKDLIQDFSSENKENDIPKKTNIKKQSKLSHAVSLPMSTTPSNVKDENLFINVEKENNQKDIVLEEFDDQTPWWALKEKCKDKQGRGPQDPLYDPTTLYVPPDEKKKLTPTMKQFWEIKSDNFDKVLFFKLGKFYELFYEDAYIGNKYLDLNWMGRKMHVGFPEKAIERYATQLVNSGFKVAVIEQIETPKEMEARLKNNKKSGGFKKEDKTIQRELVEIMTKGTYVSKSTETTTIESKYLLSIRLGFDNDIGFCALESMSNYITLGHIADDVNYTKLKTLLCQIKPIEIVYDAENINKILLKIMKACVLTPVLSPLSNKQNKWHSGVAYNNLEKIYGFYDQNKWPSNLKYFYDNKHIRDIVFSTLGGCFSYLEQVLILEKVLISSRYAKYDPSIGLSSSMILDSQALQHLEIFETNAPIKCEEGTLFSFIDKTVSAAGKRMLKRWLCAPLLNVEKINSRLDAIEDLQKNSHLRENFRKGLKELPDLERLCAKVYQYSIKQNSKVVYFEDVSTIRLREFKSLLNNLLKAERLILELQAYQHTLNSQRLKRLVTHVNTKNPAEKAVINNEYQDIYIEDSENEEKDDSLIEGLLPNIAVMVNDLTSMIIWEGKDQSIPTPGIGLIESYDKNREIKTEIEVKLKNYLTGIRKRFNDHSIDFCHAKFRYELEIPEKHVKGTKKPEDFEFTSARAGYQRFLTEEIKEIVKELEEVEELMKKNLKTFAEDVFRYFRENYNSLDSFHAILAEIDCLCSLSMISFNSDGIMCRPDLDALDSEKMAYIELIEARHPCLSMMGVNFIPNDLYIGEYDKNSKQNLMLLTGPNMGGKSTLLRMTSIIVILAQIGCYVQRRHADSLSWIAYSLDLEPVIVY